MKKCPHFLLFWIVFLVFLVYLQIQSKCGKMQTRKTRIRAFFTLYVILLPTSTCLLVYPERQAISISLLVTKWVKNKVSFVPFLGFTWHSPLEMMKMIRILSTQQGCVCKVLRVQGVIYNLFWIIALSTPEIFFCLSVEITNRKLWNNAEFG